MTKSTKAAFFLLVCVFSGFFNSAIGQQINITVLQAQYSSGCVFAGYPATGFLKVVWKKDQGNIALEPHTVLLKIVFAPEVGYQPETNFMLPAGWEVQGTPTANAITLVNSAPYATETELVVEVPVKAVAPRSATTTLAGAYIQNAGGDWTNNSAGWEASTSVTVANNPLPVVLASISATVPEEAINVSWETTEEVNFSHFELQKSLDPKKEFALLAKIESQQYGKGSVYNYLDTNAEPGIPVYYRLKMVDRAMEGSDQPFAYSRIVSAKIGADIFTNVYPNPASNFIEIKALREITQIQIINMSGQTVLNRNFNGANKKEMISIEQLNNGSHQIKIGTREGIIQSRKIIVVH